MKLHDKVDLAGAILDDEPDVDDEKSENDEEDGADGHDNDEVK